ncbi:Transcriptional regulator, LysR family [hydrothermal vent metagenome]|uniref:Transcriptional regulator, LysR family n=1 Tax=hydrothermal vent metagenome TaxID=652676 RepID=A0A3B0Y482_9ZZZZ
MDDLKRMVIFSHVVETKSFSAAARRLGIARSAISRHISLLEQSIGVRLLNRTTRSLSLTEAGETYYQSCARIVAEAQEATRRISQLQDEPTGTLRVAGPTGFGSQLASLVNTFMQQYAGLSVELLLDDHVVDMVEEGIDVSVRVGWLSDSALIARKLCDSPRLLCASPDYLERNGKPETPAQLAGHDWIIFSLLPTPYHWTFSRNGKEHAVHIKGRMKTNSAVALRMFVLGGSGLAALSNFMIADDIKNGRLEQLLPDYDCGSAGVYAVYPDRRYQQARVRLFIDFLQNHIREYV